MTSYWHFSVPPEQYVNLAVDGRWHIAVPDPSMPELDYGRIRPNDIAVVASTKPNMGRTPLPMIHHRVASVYRFSRLKDLFERIPAEEVFPNRATLQARSDLAEYLMGPARSPTAARERFRRGIVAVELGDLVGLQTVDSFYGPDKL